MPPVLRVRPRERDPTRRAVLRAWYPLPVALSCRVNHFGVPGSLPGPPSGATAAGAPSAPLNVSGRGAAATPQGVDCRRHAAAAASHVCGWGLPIPPPHRSNSYQPSTLSPPCQSVANVCTAARSTTGACRCAPGAAVVISAARTADAIASVAVGAARVSVAVRTSAASARSTSRCRIGLLRSIGSPAGSSGASGADAPPVSAGAVFAAPALTSPHHFTLMFHDPELEHVRLLNDEARKFL